MCAASTTSTDGKDEIVHNVSQTVQAPTIQRMRNLQGPSVWVEFTPLAILHNSVNLGQGAPGWGPPSFLSDALARYAYDDNYAQYAQPAGAPILRQAISKAYTPRLQCDIDPNTDVLVTFGASQALTLICHALLEKGDQVVLIEPAFDLYSCGAYMAEATPVFVALRERNSVTTFASELYLDMDEFAAVLNHRTRMVVLNSPHNPTGKVFTREEQMQIAALIDEKAPQCIVLSDEVYEHLTYDIDHVPFSTISPSARQRTLSVYSAGKTFSVTGWKIGWIIGFNPSIMRQLRIAHQFIVFSVNSVCQAAIADALTIAEQPYEGEASYYRWLNARYRRKRDFLVNALSDAGAQPIVPDGAFYVLARVPDDGRLSDVANAGFPERLAQLVSQGKLEIDPLTKHTKDYNVCRNLTITKGVAAIPPSAFFSDPHRDNSLAQHYARFAFCKMQHQLDEAKKRLMA